jgi:methionyl aminopeptidase
VIKDGYHGDTSRMFLVGGDSNCSILAGRLCQITYECLWLGIAQVRPWRASRRHRARHPEDMQRAAGFRSCASFAATASAPISTKTRRSCTTASQDTGIELKPGMIFTIEPMINAGKAAISELPDGWTIVTRDRSLSAQWEHMILVTDIRC